MGMGAGPMHSVSCCADLATWKSVLDLPGPFLVQLLSALDRKSLLALFRTCVAFRDLVLRWAPENSKLTLQPARWGVAQSIRALQLAHQHGGRAAKQLVFWDRREPEIPQTEHATHAWAVLTEARVTGVMDSVMSLKLIGVELDAPLPVQLSNLPNLSKFTLCGATINWHNTTAHSFTGVPSKLQHLSLGSVLTEGSQHIWQRDLEQQLAQLTALRSLEMGVAFDDLEENRELFNGMVAGCMASVRQLTQLELFTEEALVSSPWSAADLASHFTAMQDLKLPCTEICDKDMPGLLSFPRLVRLTVTNFELDQSWAGYHCPWRQLSCDTFSTEALARLPLHANLVLQGDGQPRVHLSLGSTASIQAAVTTVANSKVPRWRDINVHFGHELWRLDAESMAETNRRFMQALPLLSSASELRVGLVAGPSINCLCAYMDARLAQQQALHLSLEYDCQGSVADLTELVSSMPAGSKLELRYPKADERILTKLCCAIKHSIKLHVVVAKLRDGYEERVQAALPLQGHMSFKVTAYAYGMDLVKVQCTM